MSSTDKYRQFKLANGEEMVCEVVQWGDEDEPALVIRRAMKIYQIDRLDGYRLYTMRPWMIYSDDPGQLMTINDAMIIGECTPAKPLLKQYFFVVREHAKRYEEELAEEKSKKKMKGKIEKAEISDEQLEKLMRDVNEDSEEESNIIDFPFSPTDKSKMH